MEKKNILFICGSLNQTKMMHKISMHLQEHNLFFAPHYADGILNFISRFGLVNFTPLGGNHKKMTCDYFNEHKLQIDRRGEKNNYDLIFTCSDLIVQKNIRNKKVILVQEGMTDPVNFGFYLAKYFGFPRWIASTSTTGLSNAYDYFCVASEGYKQHFINNGVKPEKIKVTGIPNFDGVNKHFINNFPHKNFVLVATSDSRETLKYENRKKFIEYALNIANGKKLIFKLHPNENFERAINEINKHAPGSIVYSSGDINEMIANCDILITRYSTVVYVGIALGKEVHSYFNIEQLKKLTPIQNNGTSACNIAQIGCELLAEKKQLRLVSVAQKEIFQT